MDPPSGTCRGCTFVPVRDKELRFNDCTWKTFTTFSLSRICCGSKACTRCTCMWQEPLWCLAWALRPTPTMWFACTACTFNSKTDWCTKALLAVGSLCSSAFCLALSLVLIGALRSMQQCNRFPTAEASRGLLSWAPGFCLPRWPVAFCERDIFDIHTLTYI